MYNLNVQSDAAIQQNWCGWKNPQSSELFWLESPCLIPVADQMRKWRGRQKKTVWASKLMGAQPAFLFPFPNFGALNFYIL